MMRVESFFVIRKVARWIATALFLPSFLVASACNAQDEGAAAYMPGDEFQDCGICPVMVVIPAGEFMMGARPQNDKAQDFERPAHKVTIGYEFAVGKFELTVREYLACAADGVCKTKKPLQLIICNDGKDCTRRVLSDPFIEPDHPMAEITWQDARDYTLWLSEKTGHLYRLLSEAEWEYVARAGTDTIFWWGDEMGDQYAYCDRCLSDDIYRRIGARLSVAVVGQLPENPFGLHDVIGNVQEFVEDCFHESYQGAPTDGSAWLEGGDCTERMMRGGAYFLPPRYVWTGSRRNAPINFNDEVLGFRIARGIQG